MIFLQDEAIPGVPGGRIPQQNMPAPLSTLPGGAKLHGGNITVKPGTATWAIFYDSWRTDATFWPTWIRPQIERIIALGGNCVRLIGDQEAIVAGTMTEAQYHALWAQLIEFCAASRIKVYVCGSAWQNHGALGQADAAYSSVGTYVGNLAAFIGTQGYKNVVGIDVSQELLLEADTAAGIARIADMSARVRAVSSLPITFSYISPRTPVIANLMAPYVDFNDYHLYNIFSVSELQTLVYSATGGWVPKPVLFGEIGVNLLGGPPGGAAAPGDEAASRIAMWRRSLQFFVSRRFSMGGLAWAMADQSVDPADTWGLFNNAGVERTDVTSIFRGYPHQRVPAGR